MKIPRLAIFVVVVSIVLSACGGGGGGGGGGSSSGGDSSGEEDTQGDSSGVRVLHAAIEESPYDIYSSLAPTKRLATARFALKSNYHRIAEGGQTILLTQTKNIQAIEFSVPITAEKGSKITVLVEGSGSFPVRTDQFVDNPDAALEAVDPATTAVVRFIHGAAGASAIEAVFDLGQTAPASVVFGAASEYIPVTAGLRALRVERTSDGSLLASQSFELLAGKAYSLLVAGEAGYFVAARLYEDG